MYCFIRNKETGERVTNINQGYAGSRYSTHQSKSKHPKHESSPSNTLLSPLPFLVIIASFLAILKAISAHTHSPGPEFPHFYV